MIKLVLFFLFPITCYPSILVLPRITSAYFSNNGFKNNIKHERSVFYPNSRYTADFQINGKFIEFSGLTGELKKYDKNAKIKEKLAKQNKIELIKIYPKDIFPKNKLADIIKFN